MTLFLDPGLILHSADGAASTRITVPAQSVVFSLRDQQENMHCLKPARVVSVQIDDLVLAEAAQTLFANRHIRLSPHPGVHDPRLAGLLQALGAEQAKNFPSERLFIDTIEQALAALLVSNYSAHTYKLVEGKSGLSLSQTRGLIDYIQAHLDSPLQLKDLADCVGYSPSHFSRLCNKTFHQSPHRLVAELRIKHAKALLVQARHSILDIALICGFQTQQHFARIFLQIVGTTPGEFRRRQ
jgi:AraC family transcriptional regulator